MLGGCGVLSHQDLVGKAGARQDARAHTLVPLPVRDFCRRLAHSVDCAAVSWTTRPSLLSSSSRATAFALLACACRAHCRSVHLAGTSGEAAAAHLALVLTAPSDRGLSRSSDRDDRDCPALERSGVLALDSGDGAPALPALLRAGVTGSSAGHGAGAKRVRRALRQARNAGSAGRVGRRPRKQRMRRRRTARRMCAGAGRGWSPFWTSILHGDTTSGSISQKGWKGGEEKMSTDRKKSTVKFVHSLFSLSRPRARGCTHVCMH